jgi:tetratricopeptide (TPR) repeat protein
MSRALLSMCLADLGQFPAAIESAQTALRIAEQLNHPYSLASGHGSLGEVLLQRGDLQDALTAIERALAICEQWSLSHNVPRLKLLLGHARALSGRVDGALPLMEEANGFLTAHTWTQNASRIAATLAEDYLLIGQVGEAAHLGRRALDLAMERQDRGHQARSLRVLGEIAAQQEPPDVEEAQARYRESLALAEELGMRPLEAHCHLGLGKLYRQVGRVEEARDELSTAVTMFREMGMTFWLPDTEAELTGTSAV